MTPYEKRLLHYGVSFLEHIEMISVFLGKIDLKFDLIDTATTREIHFFGCNEMTPKASLVYIDRETAAIEKEIIGMYFITKL